MVKDCPPVGQVWDKVNKFFEGVDIAVAHNITYDVQIFENENQRLGLGPFKWPKEKICTVEASEHLQGKRLKLIDLHKHLFGTEFQQAHRARNDVKATVKCFNKLWLDGEI
jgi:DNA polymerase-3 subunit alpha